MFKQVLKTSIKEVFSTVFNLPESPPSTESEVRITAVGDTRITATGDRRIMAGA